MKPIEPARWADVRRVFEEVVAVSPEARAGHLDRACGDDRELRARVEELLVAHDSADSDGALEPGGAEAFVGALLGDPGPAGDPRIGTTVGRYRIVSRIGAGGMGVVYEAEQDQPRRRVALKLIRPGANDDALGARLFAREVETLARLRHPGIATIHDAGSTADGVPYFAMELVSGVTLDRHVRMGAARPAGAERVPPARTRAQQRERIELFLEICDAIQHAHQRGVIHRDLKPSNVLVTDDADSDSGSRGSGARPARSRVKVLDFGIARWQGGDGTHTGVTAASAGVQGTVAYMSPEQARGGADAVDVRSDVYSLGVMLYELLTGRLPQAAGATDADAPHRPADVSPARPSSLVPALRGDLEVVMLHALAPTPAGRYATVDAFAEDLRRVLADLPILARRPSLAAQLRSVVRRHRATSALAALLAVATLAFAATMAVLWSRAVRAEHAAARQARRAERVSDFMVELFRTSDPAVARGDTVTARQLLDDGARRVHDELADDPDVQAALLQTMGRSYLGLGLYDAADTLLVRAGEQLGAAGAAPSARADALRWLAEARFQRGDYAAADSLLDRGEALLASAPNADEAARIELVDVRGAVRMEQGRLAESESLKVIVLDSRRRRLGPDDPETLRAQTNVAASLLSLGRYAAAAETLERVLATRERTLGPDHRDVATTLNELAMAYRRLDRLGRSESLFVRGIAVAERSLGADHPDLAFLWNNLGLVRRAARRLPEAEVALRRAVAIRERALPPDHPLLAWTLDNLALTLTQEGELAEAERTIARAIAIASKTVPADHIDRALLQNNLASLREAQGRLREAKALRLATIPVYERTYGMESPGLATTLADLATTLEKLGEWDEALRHRERQAAMVEKRRGPDDQRTIAAKEALERTRRRVARDRE